MDKIEIHWVRPTMRRALEEGDVHVWAAFIGDATDETSADTSLLSADEVQRAGRFHFERDRNRFIRSRAILRGILGSCLGVAPPRIEFDYTSRGKPMIGGRLANASIQFNLAHCETLVVVAVTLAGAIGIDVERVRPMDDAEQIAKRVYSPRENQALDKLPAEQKSEGFFDLWTRKEALLKATGEGISDSLPQLEVLSPFEQATGTIDSRSDRLSVDGWSLIKMVPAEGFKSCLAIGKTGLRVLTWRWASDIAGG